MESQTGAEPTKRRIHFNAKLMLTLFQATSQVNPFEYAYRERGVGWTHVGELVAQKAGFDRPVPPKTCQEKITTILDKYDDNKSTALPPNFSEEEVIALSATLDLVKAKRDESKLNQARAKEGKNKNVLHQEKAGAQITRAAIQRFSEKRAEAATEDQPRPASPDSPPLPQHALDPGSPSNNPPSTSQNPLPLPDAMQQPGNEPVIGDEGQAGSPVGNRQTPPVEVAELQPAPKRSARSRRADALPSGPTDITRQLKSSLNTMGANEAERFERQQEQLIRQNHLLSEQVDCLRTIATGTKRFMDLIEGGALARAGQQASGNGQRPEHSEEARKRARLD